MDSQGTRRRGVGLRKGVGVQGFGAPVEWRPLAVVGLFLLWLILAAPLGDLGAALIVLLLGLVILVRRPLLVWYQARYRQRRGE